MKIANGPTCHKSRLARAIRRAVTVSICAPLGALGCGGTADAPGQTPDAALPTEGRPSDAGAPADVTAPRRDSGGGADGGDLVDARAAADGGSAEDGGGGGCTVASAADGAAEARCQQAPVSDPTACQTDSTGQPTSSQCAALCGGNANCEFVLPDVGPVELYCLCGAAGRAPAGLAPPRVEKAGPLGEYFAHAAHLEAASVTAFEILARELAARGAPASLVRAAKRAAGDEVRHARSMAALARRFGASVPEVAVAPARSRSLEEIAIENEVEGCVRETYGAAVTAYQGEAAEDARIRRAMRVIAEDERRHAELGWSVSRWASSRLDAEARARVRAARNLAIEELARATRQDPPLQLAELAGLPAAHRARLLVESLRESVWS